MGNCLVLQEKMIRVMKPDGKILEYKAPIRVQQVLSDFSGHTISDSVQAFQNLLPETKLLGGSLYYLKPLSLPASSQAKKKVRFSIPDEEEEKKRETGVVRIKLVISKQELQEMLQKGVVTVDQVVYKFQDKQKENGIDMSDEYKSWKPVLESIPELD